jgi:outer membrane protein OmpA-like peptidoglycan-associated protein
MSEEKAKPPEEEGGEGAPLWIISFADMTSLLMAFFVMLSTFSSYGPNEAAKISKIAHAVVAPNYGFRPLFREMSGYGPANSKLRGPNSEKQTSEQTTAEIPYVKASLKDIRAHKTFLIESRKMFWSSGTTLSTDGRNFLDTLASFVMKQPNRILISERGIKHDNDFGVSRSLSVLNYLVSKGVPKDSCNIGTKGILPDKNFESERMLEITLLDKNIY